ncbi:MAG: hypothetical protein Q7U36_03225 [bacterium]|nr:hypothetical protein [bacterium]
MEKGKILECFICGSKRNLVLSPIKINGKWEVICWPHENEMIINIIGYRSQINIEIFDRCGLA